LKRRLACSLLAFPGEAIDIEDILGPAPSDSPGDI
jgi:hypothetical protein